MKFSPQPFLALLMVLLLALALLLSGCASPTGLAPEVWTCRDLQTGEVTTPPYRDRLADILPAHAICAHGSPGVVVA